MAENDAPLTPDEWEMYRRLIRDYIQSQWRPQQHVLERISQMPYGTPPSDSVELVGWALAEHGCHDWALDAIDVDARARHDAKGSAWYLDVEDGVALQESDPPDPEATGED